MRMRKRYFSSLWFEIFLFGLVLGTGTACGREGTARPPTVPEALKPAAVAGPDQIVPVGREVLLDGRGSTNPAENPDLSFRWSLLDQPYFSGAFLLEWDRALTYFIPDLPGRYYLELKISDGQSESSDVAVITAKVLRSDNRAPELTQFIPAAEMISIFPGQEVIFSVMAEDPDGDEMVYNWYVDDAFAVSGPDFIFTSAPEQVGRAVAVRVVVSDGDKTASQNWVMIINQADGGGNQPPVFTPVPDQTVSEGEPLAFIVRAVDPDGDAVGYFASLLPAGAVFFKETGKFKWTPDYDQAGEYRVVFSASDGKAVASVTVNIRVLNTNRAPALEVTGSLSVFEGGELVLRLLGSDPDDDLLSFAYTPSRRGAVLYPRGSTAAWVWHPDYDQAGSYREVFAITDLSDPPLTASVALDLVVYNTNRPPVLAGLADRVVSEGQFLDFWLTSADPDGDSVTYAAGPMPRGSTLNVNTGEFFWAPDYDQAGDYPLTVTATDDGDPRLSGAGTIMLTVLNVNRPPVITAFSATPSSLKTGETVTFSVTASDPDGDTTIAGYDWDFDGNGTWDQSTEIGLVQVPNDTYKKGYDVNGNYTARVRVVDDGGLTAEATTPVTVKPAAADLLKTQVMKSGTTMGIYLEIIGGSPPAGYLYLADGEAGMEIFSVPNLNNPDPVLWARTYTGGTARGVTKDGSRAYLALSLPGDISGGGVKILDLTDRLSPGDLGAMDGSESVVDTHLGNIIATTYAYLVRSKSDNSYCLSLFNPLNASVPYRRVYYNEGFYTFAGRAVSGDDRGYVYVGDTKKGISIYYDLTSQCVPSSINCYFNAVTAAAPVQDLKVRLLSDNRRYLAVARDATGKGEVKLYQTEKYPLGPVVTGVIMTKNCGTIACIPERVFLSAGPDLIYVAISQYGYQIIDASDPANLAMVIPGGGQDERFDPCSGCDYTYDLTAYGDYTYLADGAMGLVVTKNNLSTTAVPNMVTSYHPSGNPTDLQVKNSRLFLSGGRGGMDVYNLTLPDSPKLIGNVDTTGAASGLSADGSGWACVADLDTVSGANNGLRVVDISPVVGAAEPVKLVVKGNWTDPLLNHVSRVFLAGNYAYLCADKLYLIDVTSKTVPVKAGEYSISSPRDVAVAGGYAYVINQDTFAVLDVSTPASPVLKDSETIVNGQAIAYANGLVYVADGDSGLKIYDVSNPQNVTLRGTYAGKAYDVDLSGDYAFVAADSSGMVMLDVSNPAGPVLQVSLPITSKVVNRISVYYDAGSHYYYVYTLNGVRVSGELQPLDQLSVVRVR